MAPHAAGRATSDGAASTPPGTPWDPTPAQPRGPINVDGAYCWQNGRDTQEVRRAWAAGARGAAAKCCPACTAPLVWNRSIGGELVCWGCTHSALALRWRRRVVQLWLTGARASDIAQQIGSTKSAVLSYRRRARLPARGSPLVGCDDSQKKRRQRRATENAPHVRAKLLPAAPPKPRPVPRVVKPHGSPTCGATATGGAVSAAENAGRPKGPSVMPRHAPRHGFSSCQYITGRRQFCDEATAALSPYCTEHTRLCFQARAA